MKISVAVSRIKRLNWYRNQELALPGMANTLALGRMTHAFRLMKWMRHVVCKRALTATLRCELGKYLASIISMRTKKYALSGSPIALQRNSLSCYFRGIRREKPTEAPKSNLVLPMRKSEK